MWSGAALRPKLSRQLHVPIASKSKWSPERGPDQGAGEHLGLSGLAEEVTRKGTGTGMHQKLAHGKLVAQSGAASPFCAKSVPIPPTRKTRKPPKMLGSIVLTC